MKWVSIVVFSIAVISCRNVTLEKEPLIIESIKDGQVLSAGDIFDISIDMTSDSSGVVPTSTKVLIKRITDSSRDVDEVLPIELEVDLNENPDPQFKITEDFEDGLYNLTIQVFDEDELISEKVTEFIIYTGLLRGDVVASYPSKLYTDSKVILKVRVIKDTELDPYLVWRSDNKVLKKGYLSEGLDSVIWDSGDVVGFNSVRVYFYPFKLSDGSILSDKYADFSILVNPVDKTLYSRGLLGSYYKSLYFNGNYIDENRKTLIINNTGELYPELRGEFYGVSIEEDRGFSVNDSLIPVGENGFLSFSLILDSLFNDSNDGVFLRNSHGAFDFNMEMDNGELINSFYWNDIKFKTINVANLETDIPVKVNTTFIANEEGFDLLYYVDGNFVKRDVVLLSPEQLKSYISDERELKVLGSSLLLDSLKVYYMDSRNQNNIYPDNIADRNSDMSGYILSEGFNSIVTPLNVDGDSSIDGEILSLEPGSTIDYSDLFPDTNDFTLEVVTSEGSIYQLVLIGAEEEKKLELSGSFVLKKRNNSLLLNDRLLRNWSSNVSGFKIISENNVLLDSITLISRDITLE